MSWFKKKKNPQNDEKWVCTSKLIIHEGINIFNVDSVVEWIDEQVHYFVNNEIELKHRLLSWNPIFKFLYKDRFKVITSGEVILIYELDCGC